MRYNVEKFNFTLVCQFALLSILTLGLVSCDGTSLLGGSKSGTENTPENSEPELEEGIDEDQTATPPQIITGAYITSCIRSNESASQENHFVLSCKSEELGDEFKNGDLKAVMVYPNGDREDLKEIILIDDNEWQRGWEVPAGMEEDVQIILTMEGKDEIVMTLPKETVIKTFKIRQECTDSNEACYTSLGSWNEDVSNQIDFADCQAKDLTCARVNVVVEIDGLWAAVDSTSVELVDWQTDSWHHFTIKTVGESYHRGQLFTDTSTHYVLDPEAEIHAIKISVPFTRIEGLEITGVKGLSNEAIRVEAPGTLIKNMLIHDLKSKDADAIHIRGDDITVRISNTKIQDIERSAILLQAHTEIERGTINAKVDIVNVTALRTCIDAELTGCNRNYPTIGIDKKYRHENAVMIVRKTKIIETGRALAAFNHSDEMNNFDSNNQPVSIWSDQCEMNISSDDSAPGTGSMHGVLESDVNEEIGAKFN